MSKDAEKAKIDKIIELASSLIPGGGNLTPLALGKASPEVIDGTLARLVGLTKKLEPHRTLLENYRIPTERLEVHRRSMADALSNIRHARASEANKEFLQTETRVANPPYSPHIVSYGEHRVKELVRAVTRPIRKRPGIQRPFNVALQKKRQLQSLLLEIPSNVLASVISDQTGTAEADVKRVIAAITDDKQLLGVTTKVAKVSSAAVPTKGMRKSSLRHQKRPTRTSLGAGTTVKPLRNKDR
ncbi:hypothetical protein [Caballeronia sp. LZ032]|uniref:hypothetical protein n=1 Tax=Caballeronia sp. LZ032 TaxID=3038565 RepID=UPI002864CD5F|nr:hypothetical protein [Caballeronia sp. LZ032]MDR5884080.1 hypothetical protein [Caballeronia sp. LZ032]